MRGKTMDVHGAGAQRSDPKKGVAGLGHGPQGDARRVKNYVRLVRGGNVMKRMPRISRNRLQYPYNVNRSLFNSGESYSTQRDSKQLPLFVGERWRPGHPSGFEAGAPFPPTGFVERLDRDGDQRVSRSEFDGPPDRFDYHDANADGYLSESEAPRFPPPGMGIRREPRF